MLRPRQEVVLPAEVLQAITVVPEPTGEPGPTSRVPNGEIPPDATVDQVRTYRGNAQVVWAEEAALRTRAKDTPGTVAPIDLLVAKRLAEYYHANFDPSPVEKVKEQVGHVTRRQVQGF